MSADSFSDIEINSDDFSVEKYEPIKYQVSDINLKEISYTKKDLTFDVNKRRPNKILVLDSEANFDIFTNKYAYIRKPITIDAKKANPYGVLGINWKNVKKDFKGIKLETTPCYERFFMAPYKGTEYVSWWDGEYYCDKYFL